MEQSIKTVIISQARIGSTRLPGKVMMKIEGQELLKIHIDRLKKSRLKDEIIVATTNNEADNVIETLCNQWGVKSSRGSEDDVLDRFYQTVKDLKPEWVVRVTSDCPLIDPVLIDGVIAYAQINDKDYCSNILIENYPDGQDVEVFKFSALKNAWENAKLKSEREHVTPYIRSNCDVNGGTLFSALNFPCIADYSKIRMTVDEQKDFDLIEKVIHDLGFNDTWLNYTNHIISNGLNKTNEDIIRNEGYLKSLKND